MGGHPGGTERTRSLVDRGVEYDHTCAQRAEVELLVDQLIGRIYLGKRHILLFSFKVCLLALVCLPEITVTIG